MLEEQEEVLFEKPANLFRGKEAIGGVMKVTQSKIIFMPHSRNIQQEPLEILIHEIAGIKKTNIILIVPNGIIIRLQSGEEYKFVIWKRNDFIQYIYKQIT